MLTLHTVPKIIRDSIAAELSTVEDILARLVDPDDAANRLSFEYRREEIKKQLEGLEAAPADNAASFALYFGGDPVIGSQGIESEFGAEALDKFQNIITAVHADRSRGAVKTKGPIAAKNESKLHITEVLRGSFGFQLNEIQTSTTSLFNTDLKEAVEEASKLMQSFANADDSVYIEALSRTNPRIIDKVREYFNVVRKNNATCRLVSAEVSTEFNREAVSRAVDRIQSTEVVQNTEPYQGTLIGILPVGHQFEYEVDGRTINGDIDRKLNKEEALALKRRWEDKESRATFKVRQVIRGGVLQRESFTLLKIASRRGRPKAK